MRELYPIGTMFIVTAKYSNRKGGIAFLKAPYHWGYTKVSRAQARRFLASGQLPVTRADKT